LTRNRQPGLPRGNRIELCDSNKTIKVHDVAAVDDWTGGKEHRKTAGD